MNVLTHKVIVITGASSGIGAACALDFASYETKLVLAARNTDKLLRVAEVCKKKRR